MKYVVIKYMCFDMEDCCLEIMTNGKYYNPASINKSDIKCYVCTRRRLKACIGYKDKYLCLFCAASFVSELEIPEPSDKHENKNLLKKYNSAPSLPTQKLPAKSLTRSSQQYPTYSNSETTHKHIPFDNRNKTRTNEKILQLPVAIYDIPTIDIYTESSIKSHYNNSSKHQDHNNNKLNDKSFDHHSN